jgi:hypothetical protein
MKKIQYLVGALLLCSATSFGQPVWSPEHRAERDIAWMRDSLAISNKQALKLKNIVASYNKRLDAVQDKKGAEAKQLQSKKDMEVKRVLNKTQFTTYYRREQELRRIEEERVLDPNHMPY